eukprot:3514942-Rhodomonas_salina.1
MHPANSHIVFKFATATRTGDRDGPGLCLSPSPSHRDGLSLGSRRLRVQVRVTRPGRSRSRSRFSWFCTEDHDSDDTRHSKFARRRVITALSPPVLSVCVSQAASGLRLTVTDSECAQSPSLSLSLRLAPADIIVCLASEPDGARGAGRRD